MLGFISKLFGASKSEKDVKKIQPIVEKTLQHFASYQNLTNDQLRNKTIEFRQRIKTHLQTIEAEIADANKRAEDLPFNDLMGKDVIYQEVDKLKKQKDKQIDEVLDEIMPEAFAVVKETARRFKENTEIIATATQLDRDLSIKKDYIKIDGDKSVFSNTWTAAGGTVTWNMVHYDVQLIGGMVFPEEGQR